MANWMFLAAIGLVLMVMLGAGGRIMMGRIRRAKAVAPFKKRSRAMRNAKAVVHRVDATKEPTLKLDESQVKSARGSKAAEIKFEMESMGEEVGRRYYSVEVTIEPPKETEWNPDDLALVPFDSKEDAHHTEDDEVCSVEKCEVLENGQFVEQHKRIDGPRRLMMVIAVKPGNSHLKFNYFAESFGDLSLAG